MPTSNSRRPQANRQARKHRHQRHLDRLERYRRALGDVFAPECDPRHQSAEDARILTAYLRAVVNPYLA